MSKMNFINKLYLLQAEEAFYRNDDSMTMYCYNASVMAAREHRFVNEEGLAEEKTASYLLNKKMHSEAMIHFINAKKCYETWGASALVQRMDKAIESLLPF
eukprot:CAMPEP_0183774870 /NCGR_PEP_ID=MMETSP0739-20130205/43020_1 /TAXON_ID=385413 /ORGANISM="Thalassiosira miniscula, Strain CCMP1093" /LENGTH=100 /DNA_ID=CAMNT_0026016309 /DNA_START=155 /DNA_END=454 /DNA_ORIENTATION=-